MQRTVGLAFLLAVGCSPQEELKPDPGVSPFYPGPSAEAKASKEGAGVAGPSADRAPAGVAEDAEAPLRPEDVERQLRIALRAIERGDLARAASLLDRILALEPINREALAGRATLAMAQAKRAGKPEERLAAIEKADTSLSSLRRAYEKPNPRELELQVRVNYGQLKTNVEMGRLDRAVDLLKRVHETGFDPFEAVERDPELAKLRTFPGYQDLLKEIETEKLARARAQLKDEFARFQPFPFDFDIKDLDGKTLSLSQLRGKVVVVDLWGTWCKPCRDTIPGLARLYQKQRRRGLEIVGLAYEQNAPDQETALNQVKQFVKEASVPYPNALADEAVLQKIPNLQAFPTTLIIDRAGTVRLRFTGGGPDAVSAIDAAVEILLAEPEPKPGAPAPADAKAESRPK